MNRSDQRTNLANFLSSVATDLSAGCPSPVPRHEASALFSQAADMLREDAGRLPPDPDGTNDDRAAAAEVAIEALCDHTGTDLEDAVGDLLCNLMHWCDRNDFDFEAALCSAEMHYEAETSA